MKNILFGSVVAAALVFSGCGSSSSSKKDDNNTPATTTPVDDNKTPVTNTPVDDNKTPVTAGEITIDGLSFTVLKKDDDNSTDDGRISQSEAMTVCRNKGGGWALPVEDDFNNSVISGLKADSTFGYNTYKTEGGGLYLWINDANYAFFINDTNSSDNYKSNDDINETTANFFTCIKK